MEGVWVSKRLGSALSDRAINKRNLSSSHLTNRLVKTSKSNFIVRVFVPSAIFTVSGNYELSFYQSSFLGAYGVSQQKLGPWRCLLFKWINQYKMNFARAVYLCVIEEIWWYLSPWSWKEDTPQRACTPAHSRWGKRFRAGLLTACQQVILPGT